MHTDSFFEVETHEARAGTLYPRRDVIQSRLSKERDQWLVVCFCSDEFTHDVITALLTCPGQGNLRISTLYWSECSGYDDHRPPAFVILLLKEDTTQSKDDAPAEILVSLLGSYNARTSAFVKLDFISWNAFSSGGPQIHWLSFCIRSRKGFVLPAKCSANLPMWFTISRNTRTSRTLLGAGKLTIAVILSGSASIPVALTTFLKNLILGTLKMQKQSPECNEGG